MRGHISYADGSPSKTLVLSAADFPENDDELLIAIDSVRAWLVQNGSEAITKIALIAPSGTPGCHLDYRFIQLLPGTRPGIDLRGSCGHSILAALVAAGLRDWTPPLRTGQSATINVINNGDRVLCEVELAQPPVYAVGVHFQRNPPLRADELLIIGEPLAKVGPRSPDGESIPVSLVSAGNPYALVDASDLGISAVPRLFAEDPVLFEMMSAVRRTTAELLGWPPEGAFPKIAALLPEGPGRLAARAISVPSWHPSIALTGAVCIAAAAGIPGTVPARLAGGEFPRSGGIVDTRLRIHSPGGRTEVSASFRHDETGQVLLRAGVRGQLVRYLGAVELSTSDRQRRCPGPA